MAMSSHVAKRGPYNAEIWGDSAPTGGRWKAGDICWNVSPSGGQPSGWVCVAGGSPGTWVAVSYLSHSGTVFPWGASNKMTFGTAPPSSGSWSRGDIMWNSQPSGGGVPGWICVTSGTPGTWKAMAVLAS